MDFNISDLKEGKKLKKSIERNGTLVATKGIVITKRIIERLKEMEGLKYIDEAEVFDENKGVEPTIDEELKNDTEKALREFLKKPDKDNIEKIKKNTRRIIESIENLEEDEEFKYDLGDYKSQKDIYAHSVRVSCFAIILAKIYNDNLIKTYKNLPKTTLDTAIIDLEDIAIAALLHDMGKICSKKENLDKIEEIPKLQSIENYFPGVKDTPLDKYDKEYDQVYSYCLIGNMDEISGKAKLMTLLSSQPDSEKGNLRVKNNSKRYAYLYGAKIIHLCDIYDKAMKRTIENNNSLEEITSELGYYAFNGIVNSEIEQILINNIPLYPVGTRVKLSTGEYATVRESFTGTYDSCKPVVRTLPFPGRLIDFRDATNITIQSIAANRENIFDNIVKTQLDAMKSVAMNNEER